MTIFFPIFYFTYVTRTNSTTPTFTNFLNIRTSNTVLHYIILLEVLLFLESNNLQLFFTVLYITQMKARRAITVFENLRHSVKHPVVLTQNSPKDVRFRTYR